MARRSRRRRIAPSEIYSDPEAAAKAARLTYVSDDEPGLQRRRRGKGFSYHTAEGDLITDETVLERVKSIAIPPAWRSVWICEDPNGHIQATGYDARGRKQYRYHQRWREARDSAKFARMLQFGEDLPSIRKKVAADLRKEGLSRAKVLAAVVALLERTLIRVGNDEYARRNKTYGLTTIRNKHVTTRGDQIKFQFRGKSGVKHTIEVEDSDLAEIVKQCHELPGYELFQYLDEEGQRHDVKSQDVNEYLKSIGTHDWTAKDFRTWAGTVHMLGELRVCEPCETKTAARRCINRILKQVAERLGNTPAVCRKSYVHPQIIECFIEQTLHNQLEDFKHTHSRSKYALDIDEAALMYMLKELTAVVEA